MSDDTTVTTRLLLVVADGVRPDVLAEELDRGNLPAMARLREKGGLHTISTSFPSVTGPAYAPFVMGRHPASVGMPGLRWFDRARSLPWSYAQARSYSGIDIWHVDGDLDPRSPTLYDLVQPSLAGLMMIARGATHGRVGRGIGWSLPHWGAGNVYHEDAAGRPFYDFSIADQVYDAVVHAGQPSVQVPGVGDVLFGRTPDGRSVAPAGRMSQTIYPADYVDTVSMFDFGMRPGPSAWPPGTNPGRTHRFFSG